MRIKSIGSAPRLQATRDAIQAALAREHREELEAVAAEMRARNLTRGSGCRSVAKAIARRSEKKFSGSKTVET
jgi:hypothetical protein